MTRTLAIVVGHNSEQQGAVRGDTGETEFVWNSALARMIEDAAADYDIKVKTFFRTPGLGYKREIERVYDQVDLWNPWASIELHFNSFAKESARGAEVLSSGTSLSLRLAESVQRETVAALGVRDRGIKTRASDERGGRSLFAGKSPAILVEPFFASSPMDQRATDERDEKAALADAILRGAAEAFDSFPRKDLTESRTITATAKQRRAQTAAVQTGTVATLIAIAVQAKESLEQIPLVGPFAEYLPLASAMLMVLVVVLQVYQRFQSDQIDEARIDDHEKQIR